MRKTSKTIEGSERGLPRMIAAIALTGSLVAFGCSTNRMPGNGEPGQSSPAAGSVAPNPTSTPGSSSGSTTTSGPVASIIPATPAAGFSKTVDAIATLKADEAYGGKYLGQAPPRDLSQPAESQSMQQATGQFVSPSMYANPQVTVNTSISSPATPVINSTGGVDATPLAVVDEAVVVPAVAGIPMTSAVTAAPAATTSATAAATNMVSNTTATNITNGPGTARLVAPTPILTTTGPVAPGAATAATTTGGSTLGVSNAITTGARTTTPAASGAVVGTGAAPMAVQLTHLNATAPSSTTTSATINRRPVTAAVRPANSSATSAAATTMPAAAATVRVETSPTGTVVVTNVTTTPETRFQRFMRAIGLRSRSTSATPAPATTSTNPQ